jgi:TctA family transporter
MSREDQAKVLCAGGSLFRKLQVEPGLLILAFVLRAISERAFRQSLLMS